MTSYQSNTQANVMIIGDIILDKYTYGVVKQLNSEAPVPRITVTEDEEYRLGGGSNMTANFASLNGKAELIGAIGNDQDGQRCRQICEEKNIVLHDIIPHNNTITKQRIIEKTYNQQLLRVDYVSPFSLTDAHIQTIVQQIQAGNYQYIILCDYTLGMITPDLVNALRPLNIPILADAKPKNKDAWHDLYLIKPNFEEFCGIIGQSFENTDENVEKYGKEYVAKHNVNLCLTRDEKGATLITTDGKCIHHTTEAKQVVDVNGAGDSFLGALVHSLCQ